MLVVKAMAMAPPSALCRPRHKRHRRRSVVVALALLPPLALCCHVHRQHRRQIGSRLTTVDLLDEAPRMLATPSDYQLESVARTTHVYHRRGCGLPLLALAVSATALQMASAMCRQCRWHHRRQKDWQPRVVAVAAMTLPPFPLFCSRRHWHPCRQRGWGSAAVAQAAIESAPPSAPPRSCRKHHRRTNFRYGHALSPTDPGA
mmetsp:Transcript_45483/g.126229  ORF Transcript_45483/g.126229 Transcript_45483/m.126229 type:complete len:203 (-) Transcript_45483:23-631(-)